MCYSSITWEPESLFMLRSFFIPGSWLGKIILIGSTSTSFNEISTFCTSRSIVFDLSSNFGDRAGVAFDPSALIHLDDFLTGDSKVVAFLIYFLFVKSASTEFYLLALRVNFGEGWFFEF